ncbi:MAG: HigA family addiction module antidote protein [Verrucomicrobia bacterium]|nr:HigA family addiction module antidote protein [Cytophagales bacterium]
MLKNPVHPGVILKEEYLVPLKLTIIEVSEGLGISRKHLSNILNAHVSITPEIALRISKAFRTSPELWLNMQRNYDLREAEKKLTDVTIRIFQQV